MPQANRLHKTSLLFPRLWQDTPAYPAIAHNKPQVILDNNERRFNIGHEFAHLAHSHPIKLSMAQSLSPFIAHASISVAKTLLGLGLVACSHKLQLPATSSLRTMTLVLAKGTKFLMQNKSIELFIRVIFACKLYTAYGRKCAKQADIESAVKFNCAAHGISSFQKADTYFKRTHSRFALSCIGFVDTHPTFAERIAYLTPIAQVQEAEARRIEQERLIAQQAEIIRKNRERLIAEAGGCTLL